jgi:hypothetical protein
MDFLQIVVCAKKGHKHRRLSLEREIQVEMPPPTAYVTSVPFDETSDEEEARSGEHFVDYFDSRLQLK